MQGFIESQSGQSMAPSAALQAGTGQARRFRWRFALDAATGAALFTLLALMPLAHSAGTIDYTYDKLGRLAKVVYQDGTRTTTITYSYDAAGNRTSVVSTSP